MFLMTAFCSTIFAQVILTDEQKAVKKVVQESYINVLYKGGELADMEKGFHPEFNMYVLYQGKFEKRSLSQWMDKLREVRSRPKQQKKKKKKNRSTYEFTLIDVTGQTAMVKLQVFRDGKIHFTDYLTLYKFEEGWKVLTKLFSFHGEG